MGNKEYLLGKEFNVLIMGACVHAMSNTLSLDVQMEKADVQEMMIKAVDGVQFKIVEIIPVTKNKIDWTHIHPDFVAMVVETRLNAKIVFLIDHRNCRKVKAEMFSSFVRGNSDEPVYRRGYVPNVVGGCSGIFGA